MEKTKNTPYPDGNRSMLLLWFWNKSWETCVMMVMMVKPNWTKVSGNCGLDRSGWFQRVVGDGITCGNYRRMWIWRRSRELHKELKTELPHNLRHTNVAGGGGSVLAYVGSKSFYHFFKSMLYFCLKYIQSLLLFFYIKKINSF